MKEMYKPVVVIQFFRVDVIVHITLAAVYASWYCMYSKQDGILTRANLQCRTLCSGALPPSRGECCPSCSGAQGCKLLCHPWSGVFHLSKY